jgi:CheY-specific phosphatase CheX
VPDFPPFYIMDPQQQIDTLLETIRISVQDEVSSLLGVEFFLADDDKIPTTKAGAFNSFGGKQICTQIDIGGEVEGAGALFVDISDAVMLAGTLIMMSSSEINEIIGREEFNEEIESSYREISNIVCSTMTRNFGDAYPKSCCFERKEDKEIVPSTVDIESDEPVKNELFYQVSFSMVLTGTPLGEMVILLPAATFDMQFEDLPVENLLEAVPVEQLSPDSSIQEEQQSDIQQTKKRVDEIFSNCRRRMRDEANEILGLEVQLTHIDNKIINKKQFFSEEVADKQIVAEIEVTGDIEDTVFFSTSMKNAIWVGGKLIMIPDEELQMYADEENFNLDIEDAYGEILNIFSGILTTVFEEEHTEKIRFIKTGIKQIVPADVEPSGDEPIPDQEYWVSSMNLILEDSELGVIHILFPTRILQGKQIGEIAEGVEDTEYADGSTDLGGVADIILIGDDANEASKLRVVLKTRGYVVRVLSFKDNVSDFLSTEIKAVYLVTQDVDEQAFGVAIKVSSVCSLPLIAAAPGWTKTKVIKAVKYGIKDILLTPADTEDIEENISNNLNQLAA